MKKDREKRIKSELEKLEKIFKDIDEDKRKLVDGLIYRASFMRITLEDYESDINEKGSIESFTQSEKVKPYERERPVIRMYNTLLRNYQQTIKQLTDLLPKDIPVEIDDGFEELVYR